MRVRESNQWSDWWVLDSSLASSIQKISQPFSLLSENHNSQCVTQALVLRVFHFEVSFPPMALAQAVPAIPSTCCLCPINKTTTKTNTNSSNTSSSGIAISRVYVWSQFRNAKEISGHLNGRRRLRAVDTRIVQNAPSRSTVEIPVTCYQVTTNP